jgi:glycosyltransferase involved in cell wall biosynthesis
MPKISYILPTRNRGQIIAETIDSIIKQTVNGWELIVVNDHSDKNDRTEEVVNNFDDERIRYYQLTDENGMNTPAARNFGNMMARSEILGVIDSDDICYPYRTEETLEAMETGADVVYGEIDLWDTENNQVKRRDGKDHARKHNPSLYQEINYIPHSTVAYRRETALLFPYNSFFRRCQDWDLFLRMTRAGCKFHFIDRCLVKYRLHAGRISKNNSLAYDYVNIVRNKYVIDNN